MDRKTSEDYQDTTLLHTSSSDRGEAHSYNCLKKNHGSQANQIYRGEPVLSYARLEEYKRQGSAQLQARPSSVGETAETNHRRCSILLSTIRACRFTIQPQVPEQYD